MTKAPYPTNEAERLKVLASYNILDTLPEESYQKLAKLASYICDLPISMVTFMDKDTQFIKCSYGVDLRTAPRDISFCGHALMTPLEPMVVPDTLEDKRFFDNPHVIGNYGIRFYVGIPILSPENLPIGTFCLYDVKPNKLSEEQLDSLKILTEQVQSLLKLHKASQVLSQSKKELEAHNKTLQHFSYMISHDLKTPVRNINQFSEILKEDYQSLLPEEGKKIIEMLGDCSDDAIHFIDGLIQYTKSTFSIEKDVSKVEVKPFINKIVSKLNIPPSIQVFVSSDTDHIQVPYIAFLQIITNLISNSVKYNDKPKGEIRVNIANKKDAYNVCIKDNGIGIPKDKLPQIFDLFYMVDKQKAKAKNSTGIGLAIVKKLIEDLDGRIEIKSKEGEGTEMNFSIKKY